RLPCASAPRRDDGGFGSLGLNSGYFGKGKLGAPLTLALFLLVAPAAHARDATVKSFDGTKIKLSFFPAKAGKKAPTVLEGHGWGGSRDTKPNSTSTHALGHVGPGPLRKAGFNVLTWDARGFGNSGGTVEVDSPDAEARDVSALINWLAKQKEA